jgi:hypothetical protein
VQAKGGDGGYQARQVNADLSRSTDIAQLAAVFNEHRAELNEVHLSTALSKAARLVKQQFGGRTTPEARALILSVLRDASPRLGSFDAQGLANTAHALAKMGEFDAPFFEALAAEARQPGRLAGFAAQGLANTAWAYGKLAKQLGRRIHQPPYLRPLLAAVMEAGHPRLGDFEPQELSNTLLALAWADVHDAGFVEAAVDAARVLLAGHGTAGKPEFEPQELANVAWALAELRHRDEGFMRQLLQQAVVREGELNGHDIANTVYAAAVLATWEGVEGLGQLGAWAS